MADQPIHYGVDVPSEDKRTWSTRFGGKILTDVEGHFKISAMVGGWDYSINLGTTDDGLYHSLPDIKVEPGEAKDAGDVQVSPPPQPYIPPTLEQRITAEFDVEGTPVERYERALNTIALVNQHLLILFGRPTDPRIHQLMQIRYEDKDYYPV